MTSLTRLVTIDSSPLGGVVLCSLLAVSRQMDVEFWEKVGRDGVRPPSLPDLEGRACTATGGYGQAKAVQSCPLLAGRLDVLAWLFTNRAGGRRLLALGVLRATSGANEVGQ